MQIKPLRPDLELYLKKHNLQKKFAKQMQIFQTNTRHPSLNTEVLEPKSLKIYSFRIDRKYRAIFVLPTSEICEIVAISDHYQ